MSYCLKWSREDQALNSVSKAQLIWQIGYTKFKGQEQIIDVKSWKQQQMSLEKTSTYYNSKMFIEGTFFGHCITLIVHHGKNTLWWPSIYLCTNIKQTQLILLFSVQSCFWSIFQGMSFQFEFGKICSRVLFSLLICM